MGRVWKLKRAHAIFSLHCFDLSVCEKVMCTKEVNDREGTHSPDQRTVEVFQMVVQQQV